MRPALGRGVAVALVLVACRDAEPKATAAAAPTKAEPAASEAEAAAGPSADEAAPIEAVAYWRTVALDEVADAREADGAVIATLRDGSVVRADAVVREDAAARELGHREAIAELVRRLRSGEDRPAAVARLEQLTKTQRGAWENWVSWHDEHGDFLVYNAALSRVDVDDERKQRGLGEVVDGLRVDARLVDDRVGKDAPLRVHVRVLNAMGRAAGADTRLLVNQRLAVGHELQIELRRAEADDDTIVPLVDPPPPRPLRAEDFALLDGGQHVEATLDLSPRLVTPLAPGHYAVRVTYANETPGIATPEGLGLPEGRAAWTGRADGVRLRFRVVPW